MISLTEEMASRLSGAMEAGYPVVVAVVAEDGQPSMSFRGTTQVLSSDQLAFWVRKDSGTFLRSIIARPRVELLYRNPEVRISWQFQGRARIETDEALRTRVFEGSPAVEQSRDPERSGTLVVIDLDRVYERSQLVMERD